MTEEIDAVEIKSGSESLCKIGDAVCVYSTLRESAQLPGCHSADCTVPRRIYLYRTDALKLALKGHPRSRLIT